MLKNRNVRETNFGFKIAILDMLIICNFHFTIFFTIFMFLDFQVMFSSKNMQIMLDVYFWVIEHLFYVFSHHFVT